MALDLIPEKHSIKNLLFTKAIPNYVIPVPIDGYKVYSCTDCGDKFIFESSYEYHINRKSVKIKYMCRHCAHPKIFYNRCNLLSHIRSHAFKTATINVTDLEIEPLPLSHFKNLPKPKSSQTVVIKKKAVCIECESDLSGPGAVYKNRGRHFMQFTNTVYTCPICLFAMPTECGLKVHMRLHFEYPPYFCPECGCHIPSQCVNYPYNHDCEGFRMMRATSRLKCQIAKCAPFHPSESKDHMKKIHSKRVYKCPFCVVACFNESTMRAHLKNHKNSGTPLIFYQCEICPGRLVLFNQMDVHLKRHPIYTVYPCWTCTLTFKELKDLIEHCATKHQEISKTVLKWFPNIVNEIASNAITSGKDKSKRVYRVVKKCDQCQRSFTYKCNYNEISKLPNECPYKCSANWSYKILPDEGNSVDGEVNREHAVNISTEIVCNLCKTRMSQDWDIIKKHYAEKHTTYKCLDAKLVLPKIDINKYLTLNKNKRGRAIGTTLQQITKRKKRRGKFNKKYIDAIKTISIITTVSDKNDFNCNICKEKCNDKQSLEKHMISHRDPCMAYQCLECGQSFVVKPSFSTHLLVVHQIANPDEYIASKECYNEKALAVSQQQDPVNEEPLRENQCSICREQYDNPEDLKKHFRVHGMAFLLKSTSNKNNDSA
ncbi:hypothetical protein K1T71_001876 [Dendrolimus kikuchii]|uniref:Uncharacterized protein n=1 Tax=Dendrolimus kikuchii TaxID=765133 RepID=A0ACC1DF43_9NEOP|nr:hypothetical protein K1T71_001876 [Dendrolimus kikuchii]